MKKLAKSSRFAGGSGLIALLAVGTAASSIACSQPEEKKQTAWSCAREEVPQGEVLRCTQQAATADGPASGSADGTSSTADGTSSTTDGTSNDPVSTPTATNGSTESGGATTGGGDDTTTYECNPSEADCPDDAATTSTGGTTDGNTSDGDTNGGGGGGSTGPDECSYVPDLDYCSASGSSDSSGATDCTKSNCDAPGQEKKGTTDGAGASSSSGGNGSSGGGGEASSGGGKTKGKPHFKCTKDKKGNKSCVSTPDCASGSHASACGACVSDSEGDSDCVPPSEGGCWVTGGGFIEGASLVPAAAADGKDNFGGNAKPMKKGGVSGHWNHVDHGTGNHAKGRPEYIMCRVTDGPGPKQPGGKKGMVVNQVYFGGHAEWRDAASATWSDGYWFDVVAEDHGEPGNTRALKGGAMPDSYHFTIRKIDDTGVKASGTVVYETRGDLTGGNVQLHPSNNGHPAVSSPLPAWVSIEP